MASSLTQRSWVRMPADAPDFFYPFNFLLRGCSYHHLDLYSLSSNHLHSIIKLIESLRITFVSFDQVSSLLDIHSLLKLHGNQWIHASFIHKN